MGEAAEARGLTSLNSPNKRLSGEIPAHLCRCKPHEIKHRWTGLPKYGVRSRALGIHSPSAVGSAHLQAHRYINRCSPALNHMSSSSSSITTTLTRFSQPRLPRLPRFEQSNPQQPPRKPQNSSKMQIVLLLAGVSAASAGIVGCNGVS
jgi:hypothetical protein